MRITLPNPKRFSKIFESVTNIPLDQPVTGICTDSRECLNGDLYIAISGDKVDGHNFIQDAKNSGAIAAMVDQVITVDVDLQILSVNNSVATIGKIANAWRKQYNIPIIGITGSNGKTTTKELTKHFLESKFNVHATKGNFNTSIGLPLTLLLLENSHEISILEMGASQIGDIKTLCRIAEPTDGLITNIGPAHLAGFESINNVAVEKGELFRHLTEGRVFKNVSDEHISKMTTPPNTIEYGCKSNCDYPVDYHRENDGNIILIINANEINLNSTNLVFAKNVLSATVIANTFGIDWETIQNKISTFTPTYGRSVITKYDKVTVIDDTYNANYTSTLAALENLIQLPENGRKIFVFGDMAELGKYSEEYHNKIGEKCVEFGLDAVFTIGEETITTEKAIKELAFHKHFDEKNHLITELVQFIKKDDTILFKGSRSMEIEKIIQEVFKK